MTTWFVEDKRTWFQKKFGQVVKAGQLPKHIAIIMDGNRRYAKSKHLEKIEGHLSGFEKLTETLSWCLAFEITEVTVYAFSIENFKRSKEEVNALFELAQMEFQILLNEIDKVNEYGIRIRVLGEISLLPLDLQETCSKLILLSRDNNKFRLNLCIAYTSREEMTTAIRDICEGVQQKQLDLLDINENLIENCLYTYGSYDVDLLVRTSGEVRLSDFLLWQSNFSAFSFVKKTWPQFGIWSFYLAIISFQINYDYIHKLKIERDQKFKVDLNSIAKDVTSADNFLVEHESRTAKFLHSLRMKRFENLQTIVNSASQLSINHSNPSISNPSSSNLQLIKINNNTNMNKSANEHESNSSCSNGGGGGGGIVILNMNSPNGVGEDKDGEEDLDEIRVVTSSS